MDPCAKPKTGKITTYTWDCPAEEDCEIKKYQCNDRPQEGVDCCDEKAGTCINGAKGEEFNPPRNREETCDSYWGVKGLTGGPIVWKGKECRKAGIKCEDAGIKCYESADPGSFCEGDIIPTLQRCNNTAEYSCTNKGEPTKEYKPMEIYGGIVYKWHCRDEGNKKSPCYFYEQHTVCNASCTKKQVDDGVPECTKKTACSCGTATAPCPNSNASQGDVKAGVVGAITTASESCTNSQASKVTHVRYKVNQERVPGSA